MLSKGKDRRPAFRRSAVIGGCAALIASLLGTCPAQATDRYAYTPVLNETRAPIGWIDFCTQYPRDCAGGASEARDVVLSPRAWRDLAEVNTWVNNAVKPITDLDHWGVVEKWSYPDDGYGDCEDYVLLKRRMLIEAGWPREALLITVVRDRKDEGHAVLTVKTDKGDFVLDNQAENIVLWSDTGYRFVKRQSQTDPNVWVSLGEPYAAPATSSTH
ncbi:MAG TPA: transglutaminase-like cysteine peptidase [Xanthobacteraceae bacterium]|nr:transglutaminase-like cysteine peptidase [Xanthobacteraceae bacterium]